MKKKWSLSDTGIMTKIYTPTLMAIFALMVLLLLPGYQKQPDNDYYPAPLEKPSLAFYCNFTASGLYDQGNSSSEALQEILLCVDFISRSRHSCETAASSAQKSVSTIISDRIMSGDLKVHDMFFYLGNAENFALIMRGEFSTRKIAELIGKSRVNKTATGLTTFVKSPVEGVSRLYLELQNDLLIVCPENIAGNLIENISGKSNKLGSEFSAFDKMVKNRPALAAEMNFAAFKKSTGVSALPAWLESMQHMRLIAASRLTKLQMFVPESEARETLAQAMSEQTPIIKNAAGSPVDLALEVKGNSIFVEAPGELNLETSISRRLAAFMLHFFAGSYDAGRVLRAASHD